MKISTISFEIQDQTMALRSFERRDLIVKAVGDVKPDILLVSGYSLDTDEDLRVLVQILEQNKCTTNIILEVKNDEIIKKEGHPFKKIDETINTGTHCLYLVNNKNEIIRLGPQIFAESKEVNGKNKSKYIKLFDEILPNRIFEVKGKRVIALCCGEINIIKGKDNISFISEQSKVVLNSCDIVLNPTHDCMANYGTLKSKRKFLSQLNNGNSIYVSSSNWNTEKRRSNGKIIKQNKENSFMQNIYVNGEKVDIKPGDKSDNYLLNWVNLNT